MTDLGLIAVWDEGSDLHDEPRAPYPNTRDVAALRAQIDHCALLLASYSCSVRSASWLGSGWLVGIGADRPTMRAVCAPVRIPGDSDIAMERDPLARSVRLPDLAMTTIRDGLLHGPVLVSVPRVGDLVTPSCARCRTPVRCSSCGGPVTGRRTESGVNLHCTWCGSHLPPWRCPECGSTEVRSGIVGATTTAAELGRAFPDVPVVDSSGNHVRERVDSTPRLIVATPGAEPTPESGYACAVILDAVSSLSRPGLAAVEQTVDRWMAILALVRSVRDGAGQLSSGLRRTPPCRPWFEMIQSGGRHVNSPIVGRHISRPRCRAELSTVTRKRWLQRHSDYASGSEPTLRCLAQLHNHAVPANRNGIELSCVLVARCLSPSFPKVYFGYVPSTL